MMVIEEKDKLRPSGIAFGFSQTYSKGINLLLCLDTARKQVNFFLACDSGQE